MAKLNYVPIGRNVPTFALYIKANENVEGYNWDEINVDRRQVGNEEFPEKTKFIN